MHGALHYALSRASMLDVLRSLALVPGHIVLGACAREGSQCVPCMQDTYLDCHDMLRYWAPVLVKDGKARSPASHNINFKVFSIHIDLFI